jgi:hypothetical protein
VRANGVEPCEERRIRAGNATRAARSRPLSLLNVFFEEDMEPLCGLKGTGLRVRSTSICEDASQRTIEEVFLTA